MQFFYKNIGRKTLYRETRTFYEVSILKTKRLSTGETLIGETYCGVCLHVFQAMSFILNLKRSTMSDLELYFPEKEMD